MSGNFGVFMSYCRQEGTYKAIVEAAKDISDRLNGDTYNPISKLEANYFKDWVQYVIDILSELGILEDYELNTAELQCILDSITEGE